MKKDIFWVFGIAVILAFFGCTVSMYKPAGPVECGAKIKWQVAGEAEVTYFKCFVKEYKGWKRSVLHFAIKVRNKSDRPQRFRVNFILPEQGLATGGLLPRKGKPPILKPGEEAEGTYPVRFHRIPSEVEVVIRTVSL